MSTVQDIEKAIRELSPDDFAALRAWFARFDAGPWDQQFADDVSAGRLNALAAEAIDDLHQGRCEKL